MPMLPTVMPGKMNDVVVHERRSKQPGSSGYSESWRVVEVLWASVTAVTFEASLQFQQLKVTVTHRIDFAQEVEVDFENDRFRINKEVYIPSQPPGQVNNKFTYVFVTRDWTK